MKKDESETVDKKLDGLLDAVKELTKTLATLQQEWEKWRKAGKF